MCAQCIIGATVVDEALQLVLRVNGSSSSSSGGAGGGDGVDDDRWLLYIA